MTEAEMIEAVRIHYDIANLDGPEYEDDELRTLLNKAQVIVSLDKLRKGELSHITNIIVNETGNLAAGLAYSNTKTFTPAQEYIGYISSKLKATRTTFKATTSDVWFECDIIHKSRSGKYITNDLHIPILLRPKVYEDTDKKFIVIYDNYTVPLLVDGFFLEYIRKPVDIASGVDCELNDILHEDVVTVAVNLAKQVFFPQEAAIDAGIDKEIKNR
jgi:hypothetical protein